MWSHKEPHFYEATMTEEIGIRELKTRASEVVRAV